MTAPAYERVEAPATPEQKERLATLSPQQVKLSELAGEKIRTVLTHQMDLKDQFWLVGVATTCWRWK